MALDTAHGLGYRQFSWDYLKKERKQNSGTPCAKTQGFEKRRVRLKCSIGKGKIARFGLNFYIGKSEQPGVREISRQQRAK